MKTFLFYASALTIGLVIGNSVPLSVTKGQAQMLVNQGCAQMGSGHIFIMPYVSFNPMLPNTPADPNTPKADAAPRRVTFSVDVLDKTQICREVESGTKCKTLGELFGK